MQRKEKEMLVIFWMVLIIYGLGNILNCLGILKHIRDSNDAMKLQMEINEFLRERIAALEKRSTK